MLKVKFQMSSSLGYQQILGIITSVLGKQNVQVKVVYCSRFSIRFKIQLNPLMPPPPRETEKAQNNAGLVH